MGDNIIPSRLLLKYGLETIHITMQRIKVMLSDEEKEILAEIPTDKIDNITTGIDDFAESFGKSTLKALFRHTPYRASLAVWGEESITEKKGRPPLILTNETKTVALLDMVDGTDLVGRKLSNWCSAMVFFYPPEKKILAALVGLPSGYIYCASWDGPAYYCNIRTKSETIPTEQKVEILLKAPTECPPLERCSICFYGQKAHNILSVISPTWTPDKPKSATGAVEVETNNPYHFWKFLKSISDLPHDQRPPFRIHVLGGNPMMVKVPEGRMNAVFELVGQKPHDVAPGAFIAKRAGAVVKNLNGEDLEPDLQEALLIPNKGELTYIITPTEKLFNELRQKIMGKANARTAF